MSGYLRNLWCVCLCIGAMALFVVIMFGVPLAISYIFPQCPFAFMAALAVLSVLSFTAFYTWEKNHPF